MIKIRNIRRIKEADIELNGITVIAGKNNYGKSTVGKLAYILSTRNFLDRKALDFNMEDHFKSNLRNIGIIIRQNYLDLESKISADLINRLSRIESNDIDMKTRLEELRNLSEFFIVYKDDKTKITRIAGETRGALLDRYVFNQTDSLIIDMTSQSYETFTAKYFDKVKNSIFNHNLLPLTYSYEGISDFSGTVTLENGYTKLLGIEDSIYIESSMIWKNKYNEISFDENVQKHNLILDPLKHLVYCSKVPKVYDNIMTEKVQDDKISSFLFRIEELMNGKIVINKDDKIYFKDEFGKLISMEDMGSGFYSFALLFVLVKNKRVGNNTLLVFDEPEAHLHTEWQVEMAKLLVLLHRDLGVKVLINSHSSLMIEAMQQLSIIYNINSKFYLTALQKDTSIKIIDKSDSISDIFLELGTAYDILDTLPYNS